MKQLVLTLAIMVSIAPVSPHNAQSPDQQSAMLSPTSIFGEGEDLVYEVSWTIFKLGTIHLRTLGDYKAIAYINSYDGLPFVDLHSIHYTEMDTAFHCTKGYSLDKQGDAWDGLDYRPDFIQNEVIVDHFTATTPSSSRTYLEKKDTLNLQPNSFVDGLSIAFLPRLFVHSAETLATTTLLKGKVGVTQFDFTNAKTTESIEAVDEPVRVIEIHGSTSAVGVYGMTGDFTGWFSDDSAAVPIKGKLKVLIGSVSVELIQWKRNGWNPPQ